MLETVLTGDLCFTSLKPLDLSCCTKQQIRAYFENSYNVNESLYVGLKDEKAFYKCPDRLRLPLIFYFGHTAAVYVNKLILAGLLSPEDRVDLSIETMMETGVDEMSWDDTENYRMGGKFAWPTVREVVEYRKKVRDVIRNIIDEHPLQLPITQQSPWWGLIMGMEHERIHIETSSVLIRQLPLGFVNQPDGWKLGPTTMDKDPGQNEMQRVLGQEVNLGKPKDFPSFGWDNEYGHVNIKVPTFDASQYLVSNREFLGFIQASGYTVREYWSDEGWSWKKFRGARHPTFWVCNQGCPSGCGGDLAGYSHCQRGSHGLGDMNEEVSNDSALNSSEDDNSNDVPQLSGHEGKDEAGGLEFGFRLRTVYSEVSMPWDWPVEVNYHEARAYCAWKGPDYRLPTEAEYNTLRGTQKPVSCGTSCDLIFQDKIPANLNLQYGSSTPVNMYPASDAGFYDVMGNVWEWTEDHFNGLPGFESQFQYDDFSTPGFDGRHTVILGGSWISTGDGASRFGRYAFRRHFYQHAGFRAVRTVPLESGHKPIVPARICTTPVYILGAGFTDTKVPLDASYLPMVSAYNQYLYETHDVLHDGLRFEYASPQPLSLSLTTYVKDLVREKRLGAIKTRSAMHMGCWTGRTTFELGDIFQKVLGQDYCALFIDTCLKLQAGKTVEFEEFDGFKKHKLAATAPDGARLDRITFKQLTWLPNEVEFHDLVLLTFIDRVQNPKAWLARLPEVINKGGMLVVASQGLSEEAREFLKDRRFELLETENLPYGEHNTNAEVTVWRNGN